MDVTKISLFIVDSSIEISQFEQQLKDPFIHIITCDYSYHKKLNEMNLKHSNLDDFLNSAERLELYKFSLTLLDWFKQISYHKKFEIDGINILSFMGPLEFHEFIMEELIRFFSIKNLIAHFNPKEITTSKLISKFTACFFPESSTKIIENIVNTKKKGFLTDQIELRFNIFSKPVTLYVSKYWYSKLKTVYENIFCSIHNLYFTDYQKDVVLLLEFNTSLYKELIRSINNSGKTVVLLNRRRSAIWNKDSINFLKQNYGKIINLNRFFDDYSKKQFKLKKILFQTIFKELWSDEKLLEIFSKDKDTFWPVIRHTLQDIYGNRLDEYLKFHFVSKNILKTLQIKSILCLNESGETENIMLQNNNNKIQTFLLQHGFLRYDKKIYDLQWLYEDQFMFGLKSHNFLLWGNSDHEFFSTHSNIDSNKLVITGSPRHDHLKTKKIKTAQKRVLIALTALSVRSGNLTTSLVEKYENLLRKIITCLQTYRDIEIIIKLHPGENQHNQILLNFLKIFDNITIYQTKSPHDLIVQSTFVVIITPELYDSSTFMLDALALKTPVLQFILGQPNLRFDNKNDPITTLSEDNNVEEIFSKYLTDNEFLSNLIEHIPQKLQNYLSYHGKSCNTVSKIIHERSFT